MEPATVADIERAIAGALTPAFLLAGAAGMLNVLSQRRNRIVDAILDAHAKGDPYRRLPHLRMRAAYALAAMIGCILASILVSLLVGVAFLSQLYDWQAGTVVTVLMLGAMFALAAGLTGFLVEATLARTDLPPE